MNGFNQTLVFEGLGNFSFTIPNAGPYILNGKIQTPRLVDSGQASQVVCVLKQNASTLQTSLTGCDGFGVDIIGAAGDTIHVILTSAAAVDQPMNVIKTIVSISQGQ